jgi:hypothetical protein
MASEEGLSSMDRVSCSRCELRQLERALGQDTYPRKLTNFMDRSVCEESAIFQLAKTEPERS